VIVVRDNPPELRYELLLDDRRVGEIRYRIEDDGAVALVHTEVDPDRQGQGLGTKLVEGALEDLRARRIRVVPVCPFIVAYLRRHRD
jgi:predicted GNAT family acetyltransferase